MEIGDPYRISKLKEKEKLQMKKEQKLEFLLTEVVEELKIIEDRLEHIEKNGEI